jgi:hypothetical protein
MRLGLAHRIELRGRCTRANHAGFACRIEPHRLCSQNRATQAWSAGLFTRLTRTEWRTGLARKIELQNGTLGKILKRRRGKELSFT